MKRRAPLLAVGMAALLGLSAPASARQDAPQPEAATSASEAPARPPPKGVPDLDELLGLGNDPSRPDSKAPDRAQAELERRLSGKEISEQFEQAVAMMSDAAERLGTPRDTGLTTQRVQADILNRLDMLIKAAEQNQQQSGQQQSQQSQEPGQQSQPNQQQNSAGQTRANADNPTDEGERPKGNEATMRPDLAARGAAWGSLPERVREALLQGTADKFSAQYQRQTEAYYRRLAEEKGR